ncbi:thiol reductant ABC exporter subunit CydC [Angustibacter luteus]|uniref:Thiol reductant ABC exporter subunit CydC n=1 Tax=Angustibacter luteus TaxID=658456 RepID=A0ABW1JDA5_9ACTN
MSTLVDTLAVMAPSRRRLLVAVLLGALALGSGVALIGVSGWLISRAAEHPPLVALSVAIVGVRALGISRGVFRYLERLVSHDVALAAAANLREQLYRRLSVADRATIAGLRRGDLVTRLGADVELVGDVLVRGVQPFAVAGVVVLAAVLVVLALVPVAGLLLAGCLLLALVVAPALAGLASARAHQVADEWAGELTGQAHDLLDHGDELAVSGLLSGRLAAAAQAEQQRAQALDRASRPAAWSAALSSLSCGAAVITGLVVGAEAVRDGDLGRVWLAVVTLVPLALADVVSPLPAAATVLVRGSLASGRLAPLLQADPAPDDTAGVDTEFGDDGPGPEPAELVASGLAVGWPGGPTVWDDIDLAALPGQLVVVAGPSGGGKTTLLLTLAGLLGPVRGTVTYGGADLAAIDPHRLRRRVTFHADDAHVFATTVRDNLLVARGDASDDDLATALEQVGLDAWLAGLPEGLATVVDAGSLSGGEQRRLLVARALLVGSEVLLLDEPTEHLDPEAAQRLTNALREHAGAHSAAVVVATHDPRLLAHADVLLDLTSAETHGDAGLRGDELADDRRAGDLAGDQQPT